MAEENPVPEKTVLAVEWKIQKRSRSCTSCNSHFSDGEKYYSALLFGGDSFQRRDYCCHCWLALGEGVKDLFSFWQGTFLVEEPQRKPELIEPTRAEDLFCHLVQSTEHRSLKLAYVFALLLERKKKLIRKSRADRDGRSYVIYEQPSTGRAYMLEDMHIDLRELGEIQEALNNILAGAGIGRPNNASSSSHNRFHEER